MSTAIRWFTAVALSGFLAVAQNAPIRRLDGSTISARDIDDTVSRLMRAAEVTGVGVAILNQGRVAYLKAYGLRDVDKKLPLTEDSAMAGASLTKAAFGVLVMQLVANKSIDLDRPVQEYLPKPIPDYPEYRDLSGDLRYQKLTARMLLSHTSGFPNLRWLNPDHKLNINFEPGSRYAYSGEGIQLLQLAVETVTGRTSWKSACSGRSKCLAPVWSPSSGLKTIPRTAMTSGDAPWGIRGGNPHSPRARCRPLCAISRDSCRR